MKKPRPATIEEFDKLVTLYREAYALQRDHAIGTPLWMSLSNTRARLYGDMTRLTGLSLTRLDAIILGKTTWKELWDATQRTASTLPNAQKGENK